MTYNKNREEVTALDLQRVNRLIMILTVMFGIIIIITLLFYNSLKMRFYLIWNIMLAALPLLFASLLIRREHQGKSGFITVLLFLLWVFIFPNSPYMITDLIHLNRYTYFTSSGLLTDINSWIGLFHLASGVLVGCLFGMLSLYLMQNFISSRHGIKKGWLFTAVIAVLSGAAIYIGRFMRFNSWDLVTQPLNLISSIISSVNSKSLAFCGIFAAMTMVFYLLFYICFDVPEKR